MELWNDLAKVSFKIFKTPCYMEKKKREDRRMVGREGHQRMGQRDRKISKRGERGERGREEREERERKL